MFIGIGGVSRAGKSTLSKLLNTALTGLQYKVQVIHQDDWVIAEEDLPRIGDKADWETPNSIHWPNLINEVYQAIDSFDVVILEGLFAFNNLELENAMDKKFFLKISKELFEQRKITDLRWGSEPEPQWYIQHIWDAHCSLGIPDLDKNYTILDGSNYFPIDEIIKNLRISKQ